MRVLFALSAIALSVLAGATAANAQSARATRTPVPNVAGQPQTRVGLDFPYATSRHAYYDGHFDQYPEWAQKAFTPNKRQ